MLISIPFLLLRFRGALDSFCVDIIDMLKNAANDLETSFFKRFYYL